MPNPDLLHNQSNSQTPPVRTPDDLKDNVHASIWHELPWHITQQDEFSDCRVEYYRDYRVLFITPEGLGVDMDHRQNDVNYFQADSHDISYTEENVEYIEKRKAEEYNSYGKLSLFRAIWTDLVEQLGEFKSGTGVLHP